MEPRSCPEGGQVNQGARSSTPWRRPWEPRSYHQHSLEEAKGAKGLSWQHALQEAKELSWQHILEEAKGTRGLVWQHTLEEAKGAKELPWQHTLEEAKGAKELP